MVSPGDSRTADIVVVVVLLTTLSTLSFVGRVWGRLLSAVRLGWDDLFMTIALLGCWAISADNIVAIRYGSGRHTMYLSTSDIRKWKKAFYAFIILQIITTTFIKLAILILYRRTFITKSFRRAVYVIGSIVLADSVALFLAECFYCLPIERLWNPEVPGKCVNPVYFTTIGSSTLFLTDLMVNIMPLPVIWKLHTTMRRKIELTFIFMLGGFACLSRIVQIVDSSRLEVNDLTWTNVDVAVWNMVEVHIGCVAANIPLMGPLFSRLSRRLNLSDHMPSSWPEGTKEEQPSARHTLKGSIGVEHGFRRMKEYGPEVKNSQTQGVAAPTIGTGDRHAEDAFEMENLGGHGIMVKTDLEQSYVKPVAR